VQRRVPIAAVIAGAVFALLLVLRFPEPLGLDQSLFAFYGTWIGRGLTLYRDLWDSKPPGIFVLYALAARVAGVAHSAWCLDALAAIAAALLAARLVTVLGGSRAAATTAGIAALFVTSAPVFGGPMLAAQAEPLAAPLLLGAALAARRAGARAALVCGVLVGAAALLKLVALVWLPMAWMWAAPAARRDGRRALAVLGGVALPFVIAALVLAARGALGDAVTATLVYPRAYAAEIASRTNFAAAVARGVERLVRGAPVLLVLAATAGVSAWRARAASGTIPQHVVRALGAWLALAAFGVATQMQMAGYHLFLLVPPLVLLAGFGASYWARALARAWGAARSGQASGASKCIALGLVLAVPVALEAQLWLRHYAPHVARLAGRIGDDTFLAALGGPGPRWREARDIAHRILDASAAANPPHEKTIFVWGLAPAIYALADCRPATRFAFHQTFFVEGAPLATRFPNVLHRRAELVATFERHPPTWVVIVHGDRSGLEPLDSAAELRAFPALATRLERGYRPVGRTQSFELLQRVE
jgi:hypothetical protein